MKKQEMNKSKKIRAGDTVIVMRGEAKGQKGKVLACRNDKVVIEGVHLAKKHVKRSEQNPKGGIIEIERPVHISNVALCDQDGNRYKLHFESEKNGEKKLVGQTKSGETVVLRTIQRAKQ